MRSPSLIRHSGLALNLSSSPEHTDRGRLADLEFDPLGSRLRVGARNDDGARNGGSGNDGDLRFVIPASRLTPSPSLILASGPEPESIAAAPLSSSR
jgi:hypothetical protein